MERLRDSKETCHFGALGSRGGALADDLRYDVSTFTENATNRVDQNASATNHYQYDELGNLIRDQREGLSSIDWTASGKVRSVAQETLAGSRHHLGFGYGVGNHRINKTVTNGLGTPGAELQLQHREHYVHDAQGNVMAIYRYTPAPDANSPLSFVVAQRPIYGSSRLGLDTWENEAHDDLYDEDSQTDPGFVHYELTDHLGNVCAVVNDVAEGYSTDGDPESEEWHAGLLSAQDYEPFGAILPGRNYSSGSYRYLFQGQEHDDEIYGSTGTSYAFEYRIHDPSEVVGKNWTGIGLGLNS